MTDVRGRGEYNPSTGLYEWYEEAVEPRHNVKLLSADADGRKSLTVDGVRLKGVRATDVRVAAGEIDRVVVEFVLPRKGVWFESDSAEVVVKPEVAQSLIALGWTPPTD
jgi:hypothetical protein